MFAIGNKELENCPKLGNSVYCQKCDEWHEIEHVKILSFCKCGEKTYLVGVKGKMVNKHKHFSVEKPK